MSATSDMPAGTATGGPASAALDRIKQRVAGERDPARRVEALVLALADAIKATSNDQNVQRLSRELRAAAGELAAGVTGESFRV